MIQRELFQNVSKSLKTILILKVLIWTVKFGELVVFSLNGLTIDFRSPPKLILILKVLVWTVNFLCCIVIFLWFMMITFIVPQNFIMLRASKYNLSTTGSIACTSRGMPLLRLNEDVRVKFDPVIIDVNNLLKKKKLNAEIVMAGFSEKFDGITKLIINLIF